MQDMTAEATKWRKAEFFGDDGAPYKWLMTMEGNAFQFEVARRALEDHMSEIGIKNPGRLIQAYLSGRNGGMKLATRYTEFPDQEKKISKSYISGEYFCVEDVSREGRQGEHIVACSHPILPVERLVNVDTDEVKMKIAYQRGSGWREIICDKATLSNARNVTQLAACGVSVTSESAKELVRYISRMEDLNYDRIPETKMTDRLGWVDGYGFSPYIDGLTYDSGGQFQNEYKSIRAEGSFEEWLRLAKEVRRVGPISTRIALAASFASVLVKKMDALPFIVHLWGATSGIGKSVALILAASVWAYPEIGYYVKTTKATDVALEQLAFFSGNMPLCLDELQLIQSKKNFDETIYSLCEGTGKARGSKTGGLQTQRRWSNAIITTGEMPITAATSRAGAVNRVIEIECTKKTFDDPREAYKCLVKNYGHAGRLFIERIQKDKDYLTIAREVQRDFYEALRSQQEEDRKATDKQALAASIILAGDFMAELLIFEDGITLKPEDIAPFLVTQEKADTNGRAYEWLCDWVTANPARFVPSEGAYSGECWGCLEVEGGVAVRACIIKSVFDRAMTGEGFNPASFLSWAAKTGRVETAQGRHSKTKRIPGIKTPARCVVLNLPGIEEDVTALGGDDDPQAVQMRFEQVDVKTPFG